jgi:glycine hydroxymethyltransferase
VLEFGAAYARQVILNAKALAHALAAEGFKVEGESFDYTETHQIALDVREMGGGDEVARILKDNNIILNMNLLPFEPLENAENPAGIRIGVQEMTRFGMKEPEMEHIAGLISRCLKKGTYVGEDVTEFRMSFRRIHYSFDAEDACFHKPLEDLLKVPAEPL